MRFSATELPLRLTPAWGRKIFLLSEKSLADFVPGGKDSGQSCINPVQNTKNLLEEDAFEMA